MGKLTSWSVWFGAIAFASMIVLAPGARAEEAGSVFQDCPDCPQMVVIPPGQFAMGSTMAETDREGARADQVSDERPQHEVRIGRSFALGRYEVTRGQFAAFIAVSGYKAEGGCTHWTGEKWEVDKTLSWRNPGYPQSDEHPVVCVSWNDAQAYVAWLSRLSGKSYRLAAEAEWEYAARAGTATTRYWGDGRAEACTYANVSDATAASQAGAAREDGDNFSCTDGYAFTAPVGSFAPNRFGLYDMLGNVWEWTDDCANRSYSGAPQDGQAWHAGDCSKRVSRGTSWQGNSWRVRSAYRNRGSAAERVEVTGFRVARTL
jgi:formylglycine-generating enzyme required for sulfatase activity